MVRSAEKAASNYRTGVEGVGGPSAYYSCGEKVDTEGVKGVAECMRGLKKKVGIDVWVNKYKSAYGG